MVIVVFGIEIVQFEMDSLRVDHVFGDIFRLLFCFGGAVLQHVDCSSFSEA